MVQFLFPSITDEHSARRAAFQGAIVAWFFACSTLFRSGMRIAYTEHPELNLEIYVPTILFIALALAYIGYKASRMSRVAASLIFAIQFTEIGARVFLGSMGFGLFISVVMLLLAANGIRGAFAYEKLTA